MNKVSLDRKPNKKNSQSFKLAVLLVLIPLSVFFAARALNEWYSYKTANLLVQKSDALLHRGKSKEAVADLKKAVTLYPYHREAWAMLSLSLHWQNDHQAELDALLVARSYFPKDGELCRDIAIAYHECGRHELEMAELQLAQELLADDSTFTKRLVERAQSENSSAKLALPAAPQPAIVLP